MPAEITDEMVKDFFKKNLYPAIASEVIKEWEKFKENAKKQPPFNWVVFIKDGFGFPSWVAKDWRGDRGANWDGSVKTFITKEDADKFIADNIPILSIKDVVELYVNRDLHLPSALHNLVQQKINNP